MPAPAPVTEERPAEPARLSADDVRALAVEREREAATQRIEQERAAVLVDLPKLEKRIGSLAQFIFTGTGYALGDRAGEIWPLSDVQEEQLGVLLVEAFPDECAALVREGMMIKVLAIGTVGRIALDKWRRHKARKAAPASAAPVAEPARATPKKFSGLDDMQSAA